VSADDPAPSDTELAPRRVAEMRDAGEAEVIDVRVDYEWELGRLAGARHIELNQLTASVDSIPKDRPVVFYCRGGNRSAMAAQAFREAGYDAYNLAGGISRWVEEGLALEPEDGSVAEGRPPSV
jgi:rhodanese-related sulfurtransferase